MMLPVNEYYYGLKGGGSESTKEALNSLKEAKVFDSMRCKTQQDDSGRHKK